MNIKSTLRLIISEITAIVINIIPAALWFFDDLPAATAMGLYALETVAVVVFAVLCVLILAPPKESTPKKNLVKSRLITDFLIIAGGFTGVLLGFLSVFIFLILKTKIEFSAIKYALLIIAGFQLFEFLTNLYTLRPLSLKQSEFFLSRSFGGVALLFVAVFIGIFLAAFVNEWFVAPFIALKAMVDIGTPIQFLLGKKEEDVSIFEDVLVKSNG